MKFLTPSISIFLIFLLFSPNIVAQKAENDIIKWQQELNKEYSDHFQSPLSIEDKTKFKGHSFYAIDTAYKVNATILLSKNTDLIPFETSTNKTSMYKEYGTLTFTIKGREYSLVAYQSIQLMKIKEYEDYLFLPFTDETTGVETYGGGRYIDLKIPSSGNTIVIDFNKSYNPYCAYSNKFSCPKVPVKNSLAIEISAGVRYRPIH